MDDTFTSGSRERDGSLEEALVTDVSGDGREDILLVVRNAGSGSYVQLWLVHATADGFACDRLPELPPEFSAGYGGHDRLEVWRGRIRRYFPVYADGNGPRLDRSYSFADLRRLASPIKRGPDTNVDPSGGWRRVEYDVTADVWR